MSLADASSNAYFAPDVAAKLLKPMGIVAALLLVASFLPVLVASFKTILSLIGNGTVLSFAVFAIVGLFVGHMLGGPEPENRSVLALATATRHPAIALAIAHANFPQQKLAFPAILLYLLVAGILGALYPHVLPRKGHAPTETPKPITA